MLDFRGNWDRYLPLKKCTYNNSYHSSIRMAPYEILYNRPYIFPMCWDEVGNKRFLEPDLVQETVAKNSVIYKNLFTTQSRQESYTNNQRINLEFVMRNHVFLKVTLIMDIIRFEKRRNIRANKYHCLLSGSTIQVFWFLQCFPYLHALEVLP